jgi:hypothetical protein
MKGTKITSQREDTLTGFRRQLARLASLCSAKVSPAEVLLSVSDHPNPHHIARKYEDEQDTLTFLLGCDPYVVMGFFPGLTVEEAVLFRDVVAALETKGLIRRSGAGSGIELVGVSDKELAGAIEACGGKVYVMGSEYN